MGSGNTGVGTSLMAIGGIYAATIMTSSLLIRKPAQGYLPAGWTPPASASGGLEQNVNTSMAMKTPQVSWLRCLYNLATPLRELIELLVSLVSLKLLCILVLALVFYFNIIGNWWNGSYFCG